MKLYIKETAKRHHLTITQLAKRLRMSQTTLSTIINNDSGKTYISTLQKIADAIGCNITELLTNSPKDTIIANNSVINVNTNNSNTHTVCPFCKHQITFRVTIEQPGNECV